jgi:hypothetical protein
MYRNLSSYYVSNIHPPFRWPTTIEQRQEKMASTIVLAFIGSITKKQLGSNKIWVQNTLYRLSEYHSYNLATQCRNYQQYGHPSALFKANKPICAICAQEHPTSERPCRYPQCIQGQKCTHLPIKCAVCNNPHKALD